MDTKKIRLPRVLGILAPAVAMVLGATIPSSATTGLAPVPGISRHLQGFVDLHTVVDDSALLSEHCSLIVPIDITLTTQDPDWGQTVQAQCGGTVRVELAQRYILRPQAVIGAVGTIQLFKGPDSATATDLIGDEIYSFAVAPGNVVETVTVHNEVGGSDYAELTFTLANTP